MLILAQATESLFYLMFIKIYSYVCTHRSGPWVRHDAHESPPSLRRLAVLHIRALEHALHVCDVVLTHGRDVHVPPEGGTQVTFISLW